MNQLRNLLLFLALASAVLSGAAQTLDEVLKRADVPAGLCLHWGATDGQFEIDLARNGKWLVHGLTLETAAAAQARDKTFRAGVAGLVIFEKPLAFEVIPYAANSVNLFVADADACGPNMASASEIERVLVPGGVSVIKRDGAWRTQVKPWPAGLDDWTHWCYNPQGNAVSHDKFVKPPVSLKWIAAVRSQDSRIAQGRILNSEDFSKEGMKTSGDKRGSRRVAGRDAFNGVLLWQGEGQAILDQRYRDVSKYELVATKDRVFFFAKDGKNFAVALDCANGRLLREYDQGLQAPLPGERQQAGGAFLLVCGKTLIQAYQKQLCALDIESGAVLWKFQAEAGITRVVAAPNAERVFIMEATQSKLGPRWDHFAELDAITCVAQGRKVWRNTDIRGAIYQMLYHSDSLIVFRGRSNMDPQKTGPTKLVRLNAADGKIIWDKIPEPEKTGGHENSILVRDDSILSWGPFDNLKTYNWKDGELAQARVTGYNQRCTRLTATDGWLIFGLLTFVDREQNWIQQTVGRSDCSFPVYPAHGQVFVNCNITCTCINALRGEFGLSPEPNRPPVADALRLQMFSPNEAKAFNASIPAIAVNSAPANDWQVDPLVFFLRADKTEPVTWHNLQLVADVHRGRLSVLAGEKELWSFAAGGRIWRAPLVYQDRCYVPCADGWVYCLDAADGAVRWRFLAAPQEKKIVAYGALESAWPVYGVAVHDGKICFSAGRHPELDGGIYLWGLEPESGQLAWKVNLFSPARPYPKEKLIGKRGVPYTLAMASRTPLNGWLTSENGTLALASPFFDKRGSSPSKTGYFNTEGQVTTFNFPINLTDWNGKSIEPHEHFVSAKK